MGPGGTYTVWLLPARGGECVGGGWGGGSGEEGVGRREGGEEM